MENDMKQYEALASFFNDKCIQMVLSNPKKKGETSKVRLRPILLNHQLCFQQTSFVGDKVFHKNMSVADSALIIDAMDIKATVNTIFIVASDSDYTMLAKRLKEDGIYVIGAGDKDTPLAFIKACDEFKYLEKLSEQYSAENDGKPDDKEKLAANVEKKAEVAAEEQDEGVKLIPKNVIENYIIRLFESMGKNILDSGLIKNAICRQYPTFDFKDYGAKKFYDFFDPKIFTVITGTGKNTNINIQYPAKKKTKAKQ